jgi:hypothetical protein
MNNHFKLSEEIFAGIATKKGFFDSRFLTNWKDIVGEELALKCSPAKMIFDVFSREAVLFIFSNDLAFKSMLTHYREIILSKVCFYFGVNFVKDVKIAKS